MAKNNETRFFYVLHADKTWVFEQSERAQGSIYIIILLVSYNGRERISNQSDGVNSHLGHFI